MSLPTTRRRLPDKERLQGACKSGLCTVIHWAPTLRSERRVATLVRRLWRRFPDA